MSVFTKRIPVESQLFSRENFGAKISPQIFSNEVISRRQLRSD